MADSVLTLRITFTWTMMEKLPTTPCLTTQSVLVSLTKWCIVKRDRSHLEWRQRQRQANINLRPGWRNNSAVRNTYYSCRGLESGSRNPCQTAYNLLLPQLHRIYLLLLLTSLAFCIHILTHQHIWVQIIKLIKINILKVLHNPLILNEPNNRLSKQQNLKGVQ